jgi:putative transcriptional regulator
LKLSAKNISKGSVEISEGLCLVAMPHLRGIFKKTILLITHHVPKIGTLAVILNRPTKRLIRSYLPTFVGAGHFKVYRGGPVEPSVMTLLGIREGNPLEIRSHLTPKEAEAFVRKEGSQLRAYLGYAGWDAGQLQEEIENGDWKFVPLTPTLLKPIAGERLWAWVLGQRNQLRRKRQENKEE